MMNIVLQIHLGTDLHAFVGETSHHGQPIAETLAFGGAFFCLLPFLLVRRLTSLLR